MPASSLHLKRYPTWLQAAVLPWLPITALLFFFTVPRSEVLVCGPADCRLEITQGASKRVLPVRDVRAQKDGDTKRPTLVVETLQGVERFDVDEMRPALEAYEQRASGTPAREVELLGTKWMTIFLGLLSVEAGIILGFALAQRITTVDVDAKAGTAKIEKRSLLKPPAVTLLKLSDVESFGIEEAEGRLQVVARKATGERVVLVDAMRPQAERAFDHLSLAHDAWHSEHASSS